MLRPQTNGGALRERVRISSVIRGNSSGTIELHNLLYMPHWLPVIIHDIIDLEVAAK